MTETVKQKQRLVPEFTSSQLWLYQVQITLQSLYQYVSSEFPTLLWVSLPSLSYSAIRFTWPSLRVKGVVSGHIVAPPLIGLQRRGSILYLRRENGHPLARRSRRPLPPSHWKLACLGGSSFPRVKGLRVFGNLCKRATHLMKILISWAKCALMEIHLCL